MQGLLLKYSGYRASLLKEMIGFLESDTYNFHIDFWDLASIKEEGFEVEVFTSNLAKKLIFHSSNTIILFLDLFVSKKTNYYYKVETYADFLNSEYFLSLHIMDCSRIAIFCKNENFLKNIEIVFTKLGIENKSIKEIDNVPLNTELASLASGSANCLWYI